jgi:sec-independent protein translocase protein TatA
MLLANIFAFDNPVALAIVGGLILVMFGTAKLPQFAKSLGESMKEFKKATKELQADEPQTSPQVVESSSAQASQSAPQAVEGSTAKPPVTKE